MCQRYYQQYDYTATYHGILGPVFTTSTSIARGTFRYFTEMRSAPSFSTNGAGNFRMNDNVTDEVCNAVAAAYITKQQADLTFTKTTANLTSMSIGYINTEGANDASLYFDAEI